MFGVSDVDIVVVFPRGRITAVQERQMTASIADNVHVFAGKGHFITKFVKQNKS